MANRMFRIILLTALCNSKCAWYEDTQRGRREDICTHCVNGYEIIFCVYFILTSNLSLVSFSGQEILLKIKQNNQQRGIAPSADWDI